jgi:hypothetical protein
MVQPLTKEWMRNLGREDGAAMADWIVDELGQRASPDRNRRVGTSAVGRIKQLARKYEERGVSDTHIDVWQRACVGEIYRRFAELRCQADNADATSIAADPVSPPELNADAQTLETLDEKV